MKNGHDRGRISRKAQWLLIVMALVALAAGVFVVLINRHLHGLGPLPG